MRSSSVRSAFTLVEVLAAAAILAVLVALVVITVKGTIDRAEGSRCVENLKSLHTSLASYIQDVGNWPQEPAELWMISNDVGPFEDWWMAELAPYGATEKVWQCPTIVRRVMNKSKDGRPKVHYTPTKFDRKPFTPYRWSGQPWLIEIGNMHERGSLACFPDGSVRAMDDIMPVR